MERDMDWVREMLLEAEASEDIYYPFDVSDPRTHYHLLIMEEAGLLCRQMQILPYPDAQSIEPINKNNYFGHRITWQGQEFLSAAKNTDVWATTKEKVREAGGVTYDFFFKLLLKGLALKLGLEV